MSTRLDVLPQAQIDVRDHANYFESHRAGYGDRFLFAVRRTFDRIIKQPKLNALYESNNPRLIDVRVCQVNTFPNVLIYYRASTESVSVVRVLHGARDIESLADSFLPE